MAQLTVVLFKRLIFGVMFCLMLPVTTVALLEKWLIKGSSAFYFLGQLLSLIPGKLGSYSRVAYYLFNLSGCSWESYIGFGTFFSHRTARISKNATIGAYCVIGCADIGEKVMIASRVSITSGKRQHFDTTGKVIRGSNFTTVKIGSGSWIGEGAIVMADIGKNSIVGAGAVVTKDTPDGAVAVGNPARFIEKMSKTSAVRE